MAEFNIIIDENNFQKDYVNQIDLEKNTKFFIKEYVNSIQIKVGQGQSTNINEHKIKKLLVHSNIVLDAYNVEEYFRTQIDENYLFLDE